MMADASGADRGEDVGGTTPRGPATDGSDGHADAADVRGVLDQIATEETLARLEARVSELEQQLVHAEYHASARDRAHQGELDLMRARLDDALALVRETWSTLSERLSSLDELARRVAQLGSGRPADRSGAGRRRFNRSRR
jgi:hypothetical protein